MRVAWMAIGVVCLVALVCLVYLWTSEVPHVTAINHE